MLCINLAMNIVHASSSQLSKVVWSRLKSHAAVKSSQVECDQVDGGRLGVILASSLVMFLYRSDSQVYLPNEDHHHSVGSAIQKDPSDWKQPKGRPSHTWLCAIEADLKPLNISLHGRRQPVGRTGEQWWTREHSRRVCHEKKKKFTSHSHCSHTKICDFRSLKNVVYDSDGLWMTQQHQTFCRRMRSTFAALFTYLVWR